MESLIPKSMPSYEELMEDNIRLLQEVRRLNNELDEYFMDRQILTHLVDDTTEDDE